MLNILNFYYHKLLKVVMIHLMVSYLYVLFYENILIIFNTHNIQIYIYIYICIYIYIFKHIQNITFGLINHLFQV